MRRSILRTPTGWRRLIPLAMTLAGCSGDTPAPAPETSVRLPVIAIATTTQPREYEVAGNVVSDRRIEIASKISGYIQAIPVAEGDAVAVGDLLVQIDDSQIAAAITQARVGLDAAQAVLADAAADLARYEALLAQNSIAEAQVRKTRLQRDAASGQLRAARAALEQASAQQAYTRITSPVDAVVIARQRRSGDLVAPGLPLLTLESPRGLLLETWVAEEWLGALAPGAPVSVTIDGIAAPLPGRLARIVPSGDPISRRFAVKIALPETPGLAPGLFGRARFQLGDETLLAVPRAALVERGGLAGVFVVDANQQARFRWLRTRREWPDRVEVTAGIAPGERIVALGAPRLPEGARIDPEVAPGE
ncbi:MAG: efflux RND transporter periplasmic adaptor subunit [Porticoccaceae bacterium]